MVAICARLLAAPNRGLLTRSSTSPMVDKRMDRGAGPDGSVPSGKDGRPEGIIIDPKKDMHNLVLDTTQRVVIKRKIY